MITATVCSSAPVSRSLRRRAAAIASRASPPGSGPFTIDAILAVWDRVATWHARQMAEAPTVVDRSDLLGEDALGTLRGLAAWWDLLLGTSVDPAGQDGLDEQATILRRLTGSPRGLGRTAVPAGG